MESLPAIRGPPEALSLRRDTSRFPLVRAGLFTWSWHATGRSLALDLVAKATWSASTHRQNLMPLQATGAPPEKENSQIRSQLCWGMYQRAQNYPWAHCPTPRAKALAFALRRHGSIVDFG